MATIAIPQGATGAGGKAISPVYARTPLQLTKIVDLPSVATIKGSALATGDVIQTVAIPADSVIMGVYAKCIEAADCATLNVDIGLGTKADLWVDEGSVTTVARMNPVVGSLTSSLNWTATFDTVDVLLMTFSGTAPTTGQIEVNVVVAQFPNTGGANINDIV